MGDDPPHGLGPGGVPTQGILMDHWGESQEVIVHEMGISTTGYGDERSVVLGDLGICVEEAEYGCSIHCDAADSGPLQGNGAGSGDVGRENLVGAGGTGPVRIEVGGIGSRGGGVGGIK